MALLHRAEIAPTKLELLDGWLPTRPWYRGPTPPAPSKVGAFRFDDPAGAVGVETLLVGTADGTLLQVPLTYRDAPLAGAEAWLIGTMEHSVLGRRWVYDAAGDPVYASTLAHTILTGGGAAPEQFEVDGVRQTRPNDLTVAGGGTPGTPVPAVTAVVRVDDTGPTRIVAATPTGTVELTVLRVLGDATTDRPALTGTWPGHPSPVLLAHLT